MARHEQPDIPPREPLTPTAVVAEIEPWPSALAPGTARPAASSPLAGPGTGAVSWWRETDKLALASALCGLTAVVPVLSQLAGLALGAASLVRIRRARRCGIRLRGTPWALAGIFSSAFLLISWIAVLAMLVTLRASFSHMANLLPAGAPAGH